MSNKEIVLKFYEEVFNAWDLSKLDSYMRDDYIQHSRGLPDGKAGFIGFATEFFKKGPRMDICKIAEDGDMVFVYFKCSFRDQGAAKVCDIYRLQDGMLAEHWDVCQGGCDTAENVSGHGEF